MFDMKTGELVSPSTDYDAEGYPGSHLKVRTALFLATIGSAAAGIGALANYSRADEAPQTPPAKEIGVATNELFINDPVEANLLAGLMAKAGFNAVRIFGPVTPGSAEVQNDTQYCVAAIAAHNNNLNLYIDTVGYDKN